MTYENKTSKIVRSLGGLVIDRVQRPCDPGYFYFVTIKILKIYLVTIEIFKIFRQSVILFYGHIIFLPENVSFLPLGNSIYLPLYKKHVYRALL